MSETKHTPGPWKTMLDTKNAKRHTLKIVTSERQTVITHVHSGSYDNPIKECVADAKLIAAAPALVQLLQTAKRDFESPSHDGRLAGSTYRAICIQLAEIEK